jgi:hypothetical protein
MKGTDTTRWPRRRRGHDSIVGFGAGDLILQISPGRERLIFLIVLKGRRSAHLPDCP